VPDSGASYWGDHIFIGQIASERENSKKLAQCQCDFRFVVLRGGQERLAGR
jgi:hypothetical protein